MRKHTHLVCGLLSLMTLSGQMQAKTTHYLNDNSWFNSMHSSMRSMHEHMIKNMEYMQQAFDEMAHAQPSTQSKTPERQSITLDANNTHVLISVDVPGALAEEMKAERNLDTIHVEIPQELGATKVRLSTHGLSLEHTHETKKDDEYSSSSHSYMERSLRHVIDMAGDITIEHNEQENTLHISVPRKHPGKTPQQLPIIKK